MRRLLELLSREERDQFEKSLDFSGAPTKEVRDRVKDARGFLERRTFFGEEGEARWKKAEGRVRLRVLSEVIWRANCVMEKSDTAVIGLHKFTLGHGFSLSHTEIEGKDCFVIQ